MKSGSRDVELVGEGQDGYCLMLLGRLLGEARSVIGFYLTCRGRGSIKYLVWQEVVENLSL